jgi:hypothetical protein
VLFEDIFSSPDIVNEVHYTDLMPQAFDEFRKKYAKIIKQGGGRDLYVQFTVNDNEMNRTAWQNPDHSDFVGTYAYPIGYVLSHPADIWYGRSSRYLRVLQNTSKRTLNIGSIVDESQVFSVLHRCGFDYRTAQTMLALYKKSYKDRLDGPNKMAKLLLGAIQIDLQSTPETDSSWGKKKLVYRTRTGQEQTALLVKAGFDTIEDTSRTNRQAVINSREPEQICFLNRGAFRVIEVISLRAGARERDLPGVTYSSPDARVIERPFAQSLAAMMGDKLSEGPERTSLNGWSYYWTKGGRRIEIAFNAYQGYYDNKRMGEKKHRSDKLSDHYETEVVIRTEKGEIKGSFTRETKFKEILADLTGDWRAISASPQATEWQPQNRKGYQDEVTAKRQAAIQAKLDKEKQKAVAQVPTFLKDVAWAAQHYGLPFTPLEPMERNAELVEACDEFTELLNRRNKSVEEVAEFIRTNYGPAWQDVVDGWNQLVPIIEAGFADLEGAEKFWWVKNGYSQMFGSMRAIIKGAEPKDKYEVDYEPAPPYQRQDQMAA